MPLSALLSAEWHPLAISFAIHRIFSLAFFAHVTFGPVFSVPTFSVSLITGSIARSARRRYLIYSEADFEVFRPAGATRCTDGGKFGGWELPSSMPSFTPIGATVRV